METRSQTRYLAASKQLPPPFWGTLIKGFLPHSQDLRLSHRGPSCHTILPAPPPSGRPGLDLALGCLFDRIRGPLDSPGPGWFLLFFLTPPILCFTSAGEGWGPGWRYAVTLFLAAAVGAGAEVSGSGPATGPASPPGPLWFPLLPPGEKHVCHTAPGGGNCDYGSHETPPEHLLCAGSVWA